MKKNILLITSDQQHWNTLGVLNPEIHTPNLDRLAANGSLFTRAYCPNPTCTPSRASIITGLYPSQHGAYSLGTKLPEHVPTVGDDFAAVGYQTTLVGKAHLQGLKSTPEFPSLESYPLLQDLDFWRTFDQSFYGFKHVELARNHTDEAHVGQHYAIWMEEKGLSNWREHFQKPTGMREAQYGAWSLPEEFHYNTWIAERTNAWMTRAKESGQPFFIWSSFFDPHPSYLVPEPWASMYDPASITLPEGRSGEHDTNPPHFRKTQDEHPDFSAYQEEEGNACHGFASHRLPEAEARRNQAIYYGMASFMDHAIGNILIRLKTLGLADDTLVVFTSDHGHLFGQHGLHAKGPFHYEDLLRVPFIVSAPGSVPSGRRVAALQSLVDLAPTFHEVAGLPIPRRYAGKSQWGVWRGEKESVRDHVLVENRHQPSKMNARTFINERYKLTLYQEADYGEFFDLQNDPGEFNNLWNDPESAALREKLLRLFLQAEMAKDPILMPRLSFA